MGERFNDPSSLHLSNATFLAALNGILTLDPSALFLILFSLHIYLGLVSHPVFSLSMCVTLYIWDDKSPCTYGTRVLFCTYGTVCHPVHLYISLGLVCPPVFSLSV